MNDVDNDGIRDNGDPDQSVTKLTYRVDGTLLAAIFMYVLT